MQLARAHTPAFCARALQARSSTRIPVRNIPAAYRAFTTSTSSPLPLPNESGARSKWRSFLQILGRATLVTLVTTSGLFYYVSKKERSPGVQLPHDDTKKTIVILGSGWGATSLLKNLDTDEFNVVVISPKNFFLFTPLLPSVAAGTLSPRSIIQPTRFITRHKKRRVAVIEAEAQEVDPHAKTVTFTDTSAIKGDVASTTIPYDYLVYAVGAETQTFNIPGVKEHALFMKELSDAEKFQSRAMDCIETAAFPGQTEEEIRRLLHVVVVGGGPTGIELSGEFHDFLHEDLRHWYPELAPLMSITLIEALPSVLPMFSKELIAYTVSTFKEEKIDILTKTMVKEVKDKTVVVQRPDGTIGEIPYGTLVWAGGNVGLKLTRDLMAKFPEHQQNKRGLTVDDHLVLNGSDGSIYAIGDCTSSSYAPTAQVASQQGAYLARVFNKMGTLEHLRAELKTLRTAPNNSQDVQQELIKIEKKAQKHERFRPFHYSHQGSLAYIGSDKAIADLNFWQRQFASGGVLTYIFWRSAYLSTLFSLRNRTLVATDWMKVKLFGRDVSRE